MKVDLSRYKNSYTGFLLIIFLFLILVNPADNRKNDAEKLINTATRNVIPNTTSDSLLQIYSKIRDSHDRIVQWNKIRITKSGSSTFVWFMGINRIDECDSCNGIIDTSTSYYRKHFISFNGFALKDNASFLIDKNNYIIEKFVVEKETADGAIGHIESKKIHVRLSTDNGRTKGLTLLIPVSQNVFTWIEIFMYIFLGASIIAGIWIFILIPVQILLNIANGNPFNKKNIKNLKILGWTIIGITLSSILIPKLIQVFFSSLIPNEIYYPIWLALFDYKWSFIGGIAILLLARAFKKGYQLQEEQNFTI